MNNPNKGKALYFPSFKTHSFHAAPIFGMDSLRGCDYLGRLVPFSETLSPSVMENLLSAFALICKFYGKEIA